MTLDDARAARALTLLKGIDLRLPGHLPDVLERYDGVADAIVELPGPTAVDDAPTARRSAPLIGPDPATATVLFGLLSAIAWGGGDFGGGLLSRRTSVFGVVLVSQLVGMVVAIGLAVVRAEGLPTPADIGWSVLGGVVGGIGITALYHGLAVGRMGVVAPVTGVIAAIIPVVTGIVLEGWPDRLVLVGIVVAIVAVVLVSRVADEAAGERVSGWRSWAARPSVFSALSSPRSATARSSARSRSSGVGGRLHRGGDPGDAGRLATWSEAPALDASRSASWT